MAAFQPESLPVVEGDPSLGYDLDPSHAYLTIQFRLDTPPVTNQLVRQAINYAVDRNEINNVVLGGTGIITDETFAPNQPVAFNPSVAHEYTYDPTKARQLLTQAGYPNGITLSLVIPAGVTMSEREAPLLQNEMARAGITVKIVSVDPGDILTSFYLAEEERRADHRLPGRGGVRPGALRQVRQERIQRHPDRFGSPGARRTFSSRAWARSTRPC